jgi:F0F1-type ATP synthase delta subunit
MNESLKKYAITLKDLVLNTKPEEVGSASQEFAKILFENGLSLQSGFIIEEAGRLALADIARRKVLIKSPNGLSLKEKGEITKKIEEKFGQNLIFEEVRDPSLISGIVVEMSGVKIDGSLLGRINNLAQHLK